MIPPSEAWLNGHINWSLPQAQQQSSMGLYQSFPSKRGGKARRWTGFHFAMQRRSVPGSVQGLVVNLWLRGLTWRWGMRLIQVARSLLVAVSPPVLLMLGGKGSVEDGTPDVLQSSTSSLSSSAVFQFGMLFRHFDQWRSTTSKRFVLNMVQGHHLQLRSHPALFCNFQQFNVKVAAAHHPIIQKEVDELLAKGAIEPSSGDAGFYSSMFVVPKCTGGLQPILNLKHFNHDMHIPSFKMPTIRHVWQLIQHGDYAFSINLQDAYLYIPIVKHHHHFLQFVWHNVPYHWKVLPFGLGTAPWVFSALTKPIFFLCHCKGFHIVIFLDDILVLVHSKWAGKSTHLFLCSLLVRLGLRINSSKSDLCLTQTFCFLGLCWDTVCMLVSLPPEKLADIQQLTLSLLQSQYVTVHKVMSFLGKANFCTNDHSQLQCLCHVIWSDMLHVYHSPNYLFSHVHFSLSLLCQFELLSHLQQSPVPLQFPLPDVVIATDTMPTHWAFYFQGSGLPLSVSGSWSGSMCRAYIALQELQAIGMIRVPIFP